MHVLRAMTAGLCLLTAAMPRPTVRAAAPEDGPGDPVWEARVISLVRRLGDDDFGKREEAQRLLLREGEKLVPFLGRLGPPQGPEAHRRLAAIRRALVGVAEDIRQLLTAMPEIAGEDKPNVPPELKALIVSNQ